MKKIFSYLKPQTGYIIFVLIVKIIGTMMDLFIPWTLGKILDDVVPMCTIDNLTPIYQWGGFMAFCAAVAYIASVTANRGSTKISRKAVRDIRNDLFEKILSLSSAQVDRYTIPTLITRMSTDTYFVHAMLVDVFRAGIRAPILVVGGVIVTLCIEPVLALTFIVLMPVLGFLAVYISRISFRRFKEKQNANDEMVKVIRDDFSGIRVIKALSKTEYEKDHFDKVNKNLSEKEIKAGITVSITSPMFNLILNIATAAIIIVGAFRVYQGKAMPGQIISFLSYIAIILGAVMTISRMFNWLSKGLASASRIEEVFNTESDLKVIECEKEENAPYIEFRNVTFSYESKKIPTLKNISFKLEKGQTLGIIGGTGCGKSTVVSLLLRLYDVNEGKILIEGRDIRSIPFKELYAKFGITFQNDFIFADSVSENIRFSRRINGDAIREAAINAQAEEFIEQLEDKFGYKLYAKGTNVSGGQKQRILLSRALAGKSDILILDDASSALDYKTDAKLREDIKKNYSDATTVVIAQRVSSIRNSDLILVLDKGEIVGSGTDDDLMQNCQIYREIAYSQMGEFGE